jgi:hypothetical protein
VGVFGVEAGDTVALGDASDFDGCGVAALDLPAPADVCVVAGVIWGVIGGGWTVAVLAPLPALLTACAAIAGSSSGICSPASDESAPPTPGPIAAPTAVPRASIPAASIEVTRREGRRRMLTTGPGGGEFAGVVEPAAGGEVSDVVGIVGLVGRRVEGTDALVQSSS